MTDEQFAAAERLRDAIREAHAAFPDNRDVGLIHALAERAVHANRSTMTEGQYQALGGGTPKE